MAPQRKVNVMQYEIWSNYGHSTQNCIHVTFSYKDAMRKLTMAKQKNKHGNIDLLTVDDESNLYWIGDNLDPLPIEEESCISMS